MTQHPLSTAWHLKRRDATVSIETDFAATAEWLEVTVPSTVYASLSAAGLIPDPYFGTNELEVQWVAETDWLYRTHFDAPNLEPVSELCFDGLDTFATVWLNGTEILDSNNMFVAHRVNVSSLLRSTDNELCILFESAWRRGRELQAAHGGAKPLWNGDSSRLHVRKAQFHYGWDWGPKLVDAGPWRAIRLETFTARIANLHCPITLNDDLTRADLEISVELEGMFAGATLELELITPDGRSVLNTSLPASSHNTHHLSITDPQLWFPHTRGAQPLYTIALSLERDGVLDAKSQRVGVRKIEVVRAPVTGEAGSSFTFRVNNTEMFVGGANWIPDDVMLTRITTARYREAVQQAKSANMTMLRVWGGGIYENDAFYEACDELGVLVWQDFMFACGVYPAHPEFLDNLRLEARHNIERLRHHPSLAIWTGNNEDYQIGYGMKWYDANLEPAQNPQLPARVIYEQLLPELVAQFDPGRYYQPGSPFFGTDPDDPTQGDRHTWDVWGRAALPYRQYQRLEGRFVSEFGMAAAPNLETIRDALPPEDWTPWSKGFEHHMKADDGMRRLSAYITDTQAAPHNLERFVYATQLVQSEALDCAYRIWRRRWGQPGRRAVSGALVWQLNDCWPVTSWAIVDSSTAPKPAYYTIKRALASITVNLWTDGAIWGINDHADSQTLTLECRAITLAGREVARETREVTLLPNAATELGTWSPTWNEPIVIATRLMNGTTVQARATLFPEPFKHYRFENPDLEVRQISTTHLEVTSRQPVKGAYLRIPGLSDNMLDVIPDDPQILTTSTLPTELEVQWLGGHRHYSLKGTLVIGND
jgi:beta-mannosidase